MIAGLPGWGACPAFVTRAYALLSRFSEQAAGEGNRKKSACKSEQRQTVVVAVKKIACEFSGVFFHWKGRGMLSSVLLAVMALMLISLFRTQALKMPRYATAVLASARGVSVQRSGSALYASTAASVAASSSATAFSVPEVSITHDAYDILERTVIDEYGVQAILYQHKKSGAEIISVVAPDENKVFGITLRTPPSDSTGVPHILEHSVLCGSRKFPVKEPFVDLLKGSLQNFLNAFT